MRGIKRRALSVFLTMVLITTMLVALPARALARGDLDFTLAPGSGASVTQVTGVTNGLGGTNVYAYDCAHPFYPIVILDDQSSSLPGWNTLPYEIPELWPIGYACILIELDSTGNLVNFGGVKIDNSMLGKPTPGTTTLTGGAGKVTVSSYAPVGDCTLYLVPERLYPIGDGAIDIGRPSVKTVTSDGDITGLPAGKYTLYTVYTGPFIIPIDDFYHGAYVAGIEVTVTAAAGDVCSIGSTSYPSLAAALAVVSSGETITLLTDITESLEVEIVGAMELTIDLNGYNWDLDGEYIKVDGGALTIKGGGTVTADSVDVYNGGTLSITADFKCVDGINALYSGTTVTVVGNIVAESFAVFAQVGAIITVTGDVSVNNTENYASYVVRANDAEVIINGNITGSGGKWVTGVYCTSGGQVTVNGTINAPRYIAFGLWLDDGMGTLNEIIWNVADNDATSKKPGYLQYSYFETWNGLDYFSVVWVRDGTDDGRLPDTGDSRALGIASSIIFLTLMGVGALVLSRRKALQS